MHAEYCDCCGVQFGYEDCLLEAIHAFRKQWLDKGAKWSSPKEQPENWSLEEQTKQIPQRLK